MAAEIERRSQLAIADVLFLDIVAYSKLLSSEQRDLFALLNDIVRLTSSCAPKTEAGSNLNI